MHLPRACGPMTPPRQDVLGRPGLSPETRADHACKGLNLALRHGIAPGQVMSGEQEHVLDSRLFLCLQESLRAAFGRAEEAEGIGNADIAAGSSGSRSSKPASPSHRRFEALG